MPMLDHPLQQFLPSDQPLFDLVLQNLDDSMLAEISMKDFGADADAHMEALQSIRQGNRPIPMKWFPKGVLCLTRWSEADEMGVHRERSHWIRLFAGSVLIQAEVDMQNFMVEHANDDLTNLEPFDYDFVAEDETIIRLVESAIALGKEIALAALQFLCWRMQYRLLEEDDFDTMQPYIAIAILLLCLFLDRCDPDVVTFLITSAHSSECPPIARLINSGEIEQKWKDIIHKFFIEPMTMYSIQSNPELEKFLTKMGG